MCNTEFEKDASVFGSGTTWFITCVFVTAFPTVISCVYQSISEHSTFKLSIFFSEYLIVHLKDVLLIAVSVSCSLLALSIDRTKSIGKRMKQAGIIVSGLAGVLSGSYYFYIDGKGADYDYNFKMMIFHILLIVLCSALGCMIGYHHDKNIKKNKEIQKECK